MQIEKKIKLFKDVFNPQAGEKVLFLVDLPKGNLKDSQVWRERREMAQEWSDLFKGMGTVVELKEYPATGQNNASISAEIITKASKFNLVIAMTEYSATSSLKPVCEAENTITRVASMPAIEKSMENTSLSADYAQVKTYATAIKKILDKAIGAEITFSTGDTLYIDLRNRVAEADDGDCSKVGQLINFPSGEGCKVPYEAIGEEKEQFGVSKTRGVMPVQYEGELVKYIIEENKIIEVVGSKKMHSFFNEEESRKNIAELGIGCNSKAVVSGNALEDEKVGLHIAYGASAHLGGKVTSDVHQDIVYAKGCPIEGMTMILINTDGVKIELIRNAVLQYNLLK